MKQPMTAEDWHNLSPSELAEHFQTDLEDGLTTLEAAARLAEHGPNMLTPPRKKPEIIKFFKTMFTGFSALLWFGSILCFVAYGVDLARSDAPAPDNLYIGVCLAVVVIITGIFTYYQERKSGKIMESFSKMVPPMATAIRDGKQVELEVTDIVLGDIVLVKGGDKVPADVVILSANALKVDNSSLTGESVPITLNPHSRHPDKLETRNMAFFSTNVAEGKGKGVVVSTGDNTVIGSIARIVSTLDDQQTPINKEIHSFIKIIVVIASLLGVSFFIIALAMGYSMIQAILFLIGIIVANVPEGISVTVTVTLTMTAKRMASKNCLVKNLESVETLGSTSVICSDKTGTLTQNKMTVAHFWINNQIIQLETGEEGYGRNFNKENTPGWMELSRVACLCSTAQFSEDNTHLSPLKREMTGDASEQGILRCYEAIMGNTTVFREANPKLQEIPFNSRLKYQVSVHEVNRSGRYLVVMKGAPEIVFKRCKHILLDGQSVQIDESVVEMFTEASRELAARGERVLGFCDLPLDEETFPPGFIFTTEEEPNFPTQGLRFIGLMSMIDPPKSNVPEAVRLCRSAGIKVVMVTGDHPLTAAAIARQVGIISPGVSQTVYTEQTDSHANPGSAAVITGKVLEQLIEEDLDAVILHHPEIVFARTSPQQKLRIVNAFQRRGAVVAVTGDGVNDSPALKRGDIGVAMGISGSEVSKEAADMILLDDNFATIVTGIEEGRLIFDNLKKSIVYTLTSNVPEILPFLSWVILNIPLPLSTIAILLIDLGTDLFPAMSLAHEQPESDLMARRPRDPDLDKLVNRRLIFLSYGVIGILQAAAGFFVYFVIMAEHGWFPRRLYGIRTEWDNPNVDNLEDSFGQQWSYGQRQLLQDVCQTAYFLAIVQVQWADLIISKTRTVSILTQGMKNRTLNIALVFETLLAILIIYTPYLPRNIGLYPLNPSWWIPALPFSFIIIVMDELRRFVIRREENLVFGKFVKESTFY